MKKRRFYLPIIVIFSFIVNGNCQTTRSEFEIIRSIFQSEKKSFFEKHMNLTSAEEKVFWPIYEDYEIDRSKYANQRLDALRFFVENYDNMSDKQASNLMDEIFDIQKRDWKLRKKYFRMMQGKMSTAKAVRFIQIEEYINSSIKQKVLEVLPFIKE